MSAIEHPSPRGSRRVLILGTVVMAAAAAGVLTLGTQDARLLRLGLVAALWAALLGAFATARVPREIVELRTELTAMRATLEQLLGGPARVSPSLVERVTPQAESTHLLPLPAHPRTFDDSRGRAAAAPVLTGPEPRFGPIRPTPASGSSSSSTPAVTSNAVTSNGHGRHGVPSSQRTVDDLLAANGRSSVPRRSLT
ncbi:MAG: hypothetical protein ACRDRI_09435 [Pseudonocardiaceae bacterium]